jgi:superfamily II DNA or RNA helicase
MSSILDRLYPYQKDAVFQTLINPKGIVCLPTGTGKTYCQATIIANDIIMNKGQHNLYVVNAPRILLTFQLLKEVYAFLTSYGIDARYMFVHSGGKTDEQELEDVRVQSIMDGHNIPFAEIGSGTNINAIQDMMKKAQKQKMPLIFFSTYNSAEKIETARAKFKTPISIVVNDESHYLVQEQFHDILHTLEARRCYFFTATTIHTPSDKGRGMNNVDMYGNILYKMTPRQAIDKGKMVRPRVHVVKSDDISYDNYNSEDYNKSLSNIIYEAFEQHKSVLDKQKPKLLISVKGTQNILTFLGSTRYKQLRSEGVGIYAVASNEDVGNDINGEKVTRQVFLKRLKDDGSDIDKSLIVLHYDILAEGIDVSGFTGIMPLRTLNKSKFLQTYGRSARLDPQDRANIENGSVKPDELEKLNKPYAYILIQNIIHDNEDDKQNMIQLISELRDYGFNPSEDIISSSMVNGVPELDELDGLNDIKIKLPNIGVLIENLEAEIESEENAKLSKKEFLLKQLSMFDDGSTT